MSTPLLITTDDPRRPDVLELLDTHLTFANETTPVCHVHALDVERLLDPSIVFYTARRDGAVLGMGALKRLDSDHAEIKSMHTARAARGQGVGQAMLDHLLRMAADAGYRRVSLETGTMEAFAPARRLYARMGFEPCQPFGEYTDIPHSICMTLPLADRVNRG